MQNIVLISRLTFFSRSFRVFARSYSVIFVWLFSPPSRCCDGVGVRTACNTAFWANRSSMFFCAWANYWFRLAIRALGPMDSAASWVLFLPELVQRVFTMTDFIYFFKEQCRFHKQRQTVSTVSSMVTCRLVIRQKASSSLLSLGSTKMTND
jgi:hypothetical protein